MQTSEGPAEQLSSLPSRRWRGGGGAAARRMGRARGAHTHEEIGREGRDGIPIENGHYPTSHQLRAISV